MLSYHDGNVTNILVTSNIKFTNKQIFLLYGNITKYSVTN